MKSIVLTGGGTAGHVMPHFALLPLLKANGWDVFYIGSSGIEKQLVGEAGITFKEISAGKLRRYLSLQNLIDVGKVMLGFLQSLVILVRRRPRVVFSKGGFVSVPVCLAARLLGIPVITHESDLTPGLATKMIAPFASQVLYTFEETAKYMPSGAVQVGGIVRSEIQQGNIARGLELCRFQEDDARPIVLVMGGSLGAKKINDCLQAALPMLLREFRIIHITGKGKRIEVEANGYFSFEFVGEELRDLYAITNLGVGRAGANSIFELLSLHIPMLLIPLEEGSRGDQVHNAESFRKRGWARVVRERDLQPANLIRELMLLRQSSDSLRRQQQGYAAGEGCQKILTLIEAYGSKD